MAKNKKPSKKYKPKYVLVNPMGFVMENMTSVSSHTSFMLDLNIKNHSALTMLTTGKGIYVTDNAGNEYCDEVFGDECTQHGHGTA